MIDDPIMDRVEFCVIRLQNLTGVPRWRMTCVLVVAWCTVCLISFSRLPLVTYALFGLVSLVMSLRVIRSVIKVDKTWQALADAKQAVVPNPARHNLQGATLRLLVWVLFILCLTDSLQIILRQFLLALFITVDNCNTWPMLGPTLKERLKRHWTALATKQVTAGEEG